MLAKLAQVFDKVYFTQLYKQELADAVTKAGFYELPYSVRDAAPFKAEHVGWRVRRFFGLPSEFSKEGLLFFFFGVVPLNKEKAAPPVLMAILIGIGTFLFRLLTLLPNLALNIIRLVTEFLPFLLMQGLRIPTKFCLNHLISKNGSLPAKVLFGIGSLVFAPLYLAASLWYFVGCATTSPIESIHSGFRYGKEFFPKNSFLEKPVGVLLATLSLLTTVVVYTLLFPFVLSYLATLMPQGISALAGWLTTNCAGFCAWIGSTTVGTYLTSFGLGASWLMGVAGIAATTSLFGSILLAIGYRANSAVEAGFVEQAVLGDQNPEDKPVYAPPFTRYLANDVLRTVSYEAGSVRSQQLFGVVAFDCSYTPKQVLSDFFSPKSTHTSSLFSSSSIQPRINKGTMKL